MLKWVGWAAVALSGAGSMLMVVAYFTHDATGQQALTSLAFVATMLCGFLVVRREQRAALADRQSRSSRHILPAWVSRVQVSAFVVAIACYVACAVLFARHEEELGRDSLLLGALANLVGFLPRLLVDRRDRSRENS